MQEIVPQFHAMHIDLPNRHVAAYFKQLIQVALKAGDPVQAVRGAVQRKGDLLVVGTRQYDLSHIPKVVVVGAGKASGHMAKDLEGIFAHSVTVRLGLRLPEIWLGRHACDRTGSSLLLDP